VFGGQELPPNSHLTKAILGMGGLQALVSLLPGARRLLGTSPLGLVDLLVIAAGVLVPLIINEATKQAPPAKLHEQKEDTNEPDDEAIEQVQESMV
jgi:Ca2+-transporting ATPase